MPAFRIQIQCIRFSYFVLKLRVKNHHKCSLKTFCRQIIPEEQTKLTDLLLAKLSAPPSTVRFT